MFFADTPYIGDGRSAALSILLKEISAMMIAGASYGPSMVNSALSAISRGQALQQSAAESIASGAPMESDNLGADEAVALKQGEVQAEVGAKILESYESTVGRLIDITV